jgi:branched-chain amino acid transport system ATP-binding protein
MNTPLLAINNLSVSYGQVPALNDVTLHVNAGELVVLLGPNGAGKTTTLRAISSLNRARSGEILLGGQELHKKSAAAVTRCGVGHVPEGRKIFPEHTVMENLQLGAYILRRKRAEREESIEAMLNLFPRLRERSSQAAGTLSGGEAQMLACARALVSKPKLLMLDEPSLGIAPQLVAELFSYVIRLNREQGLTVLLVEQNAKLALEIADRGYVFSNGRIAISGTGEQLRSNSDVQQIFLGGGSPTAQAGQQ